jgi:hypothetical protein
MAEYHTVYKGPEGQTTQWEDIHRKLGNLPPKEPVWKPDPYAPAEEPARDDAWIDGKEEAELSDLEDEFPDDRFLEEYRCARGSRAAQALFRRSGAWRAIRRGGARHPCSAAATPRLTSPPPPTPALALALLPPPGAAG